MTRINCIPVTELHKKHLGAEYYELPRVFRLVERYQAKGGDPAQLRLHGQPADYVLGKGHVKFFYDKLLWLSWRHVRLADELARRGGSPNFRENLRVTFAHLDSHWFNDWEPSEAAMALSRSRIDERLKEMSK